VLIRSGNKRQQKKLHICDGKPKGNVFIYIGVARGGQRGHALPKCFENIVILCFKRRFSKQNSVIRLK